MFNKIDLSAHFFSIPPGRWTYLFANFIVATYLILFQSGVMGYVGFYLPAISHMLSPIFYLIYGMAALLVLSLTFERVPEKEKIVKLWIYCTFALVPILFVNNRHDDITKNYIVGIGSIAIFTTIAFLGDARRIGQLAASITALLSFACLLDASFSDGFTNTLGRAASLLTNPNIAALALLLGATGSVWAIPSRWRIPFIVFVGGSVFATLSRSSMFVGTVVLLSTVPLLLPEWRRHLSYFKSTFRLTAVSFLLTICLLGAAFVNNSAFGLAAGNAFQGLKAAISTLQEIQSKHSDDSDGAGNRQSHKLSEITAAMVEEAEHENSASARAILFERAWHVYRVGPASGQGLQRAFSLIPHNSQLLLLVAFGHSGWLIVPLLVALILVLGGWRRGLPAAVVVSGGAFFSHDLLLAIPLIAGLVVVLAGLIATNRSQVTVREGTSVRVPFYIPITAFAGASLLALYLQSTNMQTYSFDIPTDEIKSINGSLYYVVLPPAMPRGLVRLSPWSREMSLTESGYALDYASEFSKKKLSLNRGQYGVKNMWLWFLPTDDGSPMDNGKSYRFSDRLVVNPGFEMLILSVLTWAAAWVFFDLRNNALGNVKCAD